MIVEAWIGHIDWIVVGDLGFPLVAIQLEALAIGGGTQFGTQPAGVLPSVLGYHLNGNFVLGFWFWPGFKKNVSVLVFLSVLVLGMSEHAIGNYILAGTRTPY